MNKELTQEEIQKVFSMYRGSEFVWAYGAEDQQISVLDGVSVNSNVFSTECDDSGEGIFGMSECRLILTPLSAISDEHSAELSEVFFPDGNIYDYLHGAPTGKAIVASIRANRQTNTFYPQARVHDGFEYLKMKGYAVPLFLGLNHWANGKTAIELGIAIDSTTLNTQNNE